MNQISNELNQYMSFAGSKKGVLSLGGQVIYLYDNRCSPAFCRQLCMQSVGYTVETNDPTQSFFFWVHNGEWTFVTDAKTIRNSGQFGCLLHLYAEEDSTLRVIFYANDSSAHSILFTDETVENLFFALLQRKRYTEIPFSSQDLQELAQQQNLESLKHLTSLYLHGKPVSDISL